MGGSFGQRHLPIAGYSKIIMNGFFFLQYSFSLLCAQSSQHIQIKIHYCTSKSSIIINVMYVFVLRLMSTSLVNTMVPTWLEDSLAQGRERKDPKPWTSLLQLQADQKHSTSHLHTHLLSVISNVSITVHWQNLKSFPWITKSGR